ncbi:MAG TPA: TolC family protein [Thermoanaerobaculia bacterium]|nr:TolC family protein [Thermoanaerobaculia bacterium]
MMRRLSLLLALVLSACIHIAPKPIVPAQTAQQLESRSLADAGLQKFVAAHVSGGTTPITRWDLERLTLAAFYFHPDLDIARADAAVARAAIATAGQRPDPSVTLPVEHKGDPGVTPWVLVLGFDFQIETANKRGLRMRHAEDLSQAAELAIAQDAWQLRSAIRAQLVALTAAGESVAILQRQRDAQNDLVEALQKRFDLGQGSRVELTQARIASRQTALLLRDRQTQIAQARARLAAAIGVPLNGAKDSEFDFDPRALPAATLPTDLRERALTTRPDILVSLAQYAAAESDLRLELARQYPDFHIAPGFGWDQGHQRWDFGFASVAPIFSRNRGSILEAERRRSASEARFVALQSRVIAAADEASEVYRQALAKVEETASILSLQRAQLDAAQRSFNAGQIDRVALRTAELEFAAAELARTDAVAQAQQALGALEDAIEQPLSGTALPAAPRVNPRESQR